MDFAEAYFTTFLPTKTDTPLLDGYGSYNAHVAIRFTDTEKVWELEVRNGMIKNIAPAHQTQAPIRFDVDRQVFRDIVEGRISPQKAFFARKTNIRGDLLGGMRLAKLLAIFFKQHPWNGDAYPTTV